MKLLDYKCDYKLQHDYKYNYSTGVTQAKDAGGVSE